MDANFEPENHLCARQRWFEDFRVGERFPLPSRTMTDALFAAFALASGDNHPVHYDVEYCRERGMPLDGHAVEIIHARAAEMPIRDRKAGWLDQMRGDAKACAKPQNRSGILRDVGLVKRELHEAIQTLFRGVPRAKK